MPLSLVGHFSLSFPTTVQELMNRGVKQGTQKNQREREEEKVREKWLAWSVAISQKRKINTSRNVACHVWTKEKEEEKS